LVSIFVCLQKLFQGFKVSKFETAAPLREIATLSRETVQLTLVRVRMRTLYITGSYLTSFERLLHDGFILCDYYVITMR
jgi:hypothetical protein